MQITCNAADWQYAFELCQNAAWRAQVFNALPLKKMRNSAIIKHLRVIRAHFRDFLRKNYAVALAHKKKHENK